MLNAQSILKFQNWSLMAISFCIPLVPKLVPVLLFIFASLSITALIKGYRRVEITEVGILLIGLYVLHVIGMLFTENVDRGLFDLEVKLSLLALPISFHWLWKPRQGTLREDSAGISYWNNTRGCFLLSPECL